MFHFTLWPSVRSNEGGHTEMAWADFLTFVTNPAVVADISDARLEGWSPVRFAGNRRGMAYVESVSAIVLDDDKTGLPLADVAALWSFAAGAIHTSRSHTAAAPRYRIILRTTRDMTAAEFPIVWRAVRDLAVARGQTLDESTKDPSRLWFCPAHLPGAPYQWVELSGMAINVDAILSAVPADAPPVATAPREPAATAAPAEGRRMAMAAALGAAWPAKGRHQAQLALAGALRAEGFTEPEAVDFLCAVCRAAGNEDRAKRAKTVAHTYGLKPDDKMTSWTRLKSFVDPVVVDAARAALGREAEWTESVNRRLREAARPAANDTTPDDGHHRRTSSGLIYRCGGWSEPLPPPVYVVGELLHAGAVSMLLAHGGSGKSMAAMSLAVAVARGEPWLARFQTLQGPALYFDFERNEYEARRRVLLLRLGDGLSNFCYFQHPAVYADDPAFWEGLGELNPRLVTIDGLAASSPGLDENAKEGAIPLSLAKRFATKTNAHVQFVHHENKGGNTDTRLRVRGSTSIFAVLDTGFNLEPIDAPEGIKRTRVSSFKFNLGREPSPFAIELSDERGLVLYEEQAVTVGRAAQTDDQLKEAVKLTIASGNIQGVKALAKKLGRNEKRVGEVLRLLVESKEVVKMETGYVLDDETKRTERVLAFVRAHTSDPRVTTPSRLAKLAKVEPAVVERLLFDRKLVTNAGGGGFIATG